MCREDASERLTKQSGAHTSRQKLRAHALVRLAEVNYLSFHQSRPILGTSHVLWSTSRILLQQRPAGQFEFVEWTPDNHLRHSRFIALRDDKAGRSITREVATIMTKTRA